VQFVFVVSFGRPLSCQVLLTEVHRTKDPELLDFLLIVRCRSQMGAVVLVFQNESAAAFDKHSWSVVSSRVQRNTLRGWWPERSGKVQILTHSAFCNVQVGQTMLRLERGLRCQSPFEGQVVISISMFNLALLSCA
jgi:hypothetical protein